MKNNTPAQKNNLSALARLCFYLAAPLLFLASIVWLSGIGILEIDGGGGSISYVEGLIGGPSLILMIPMFLIIGNAIAEKRKVLGGFVAVLGLLGSIGGYMAMVIFRVMSYDLIRFGLESSQMQEYWTQFFGYSHIFLFLGPLFPLVHILVGISLWSMVFVPRWVAIFLIIGGILFPIAQIAGVMFLWPISTGLFAIAYPYLGYLFFGNKPK
ncbi:MAG: hypothetical protein R2828_25785 [Saprospiraceae bacterium]